MTIKNLYKSPWVISITTALITPFIIDYLKNIPISTTFRSILHSVCNISIHLLTTKIPVWGVILGLLMILLMGLVVRKWMQLRKPAFLDYRDDKFQYWNWRWDYQYDSVSKKWHIIDLMADCPNCGKSMNNKSSKIFRRFSCSCGFNITDGDSDDARNVKAAIEGKMKRIQNSQRKNN